jgi:long-chain acyl-CoA synthetase
VQLDRTVHQLTTSEYVALEKLEGMFALDPLFATLLVHGDSTQASIVAVAVLDPLQASGLVKKVLGKSVPATDLAGLEEQVVDPRIRKEILKGLTKVAKQNRLNGYVTFSWSHSSTDKHRFEMIKGLHVTVKPFAEHLLTPTLKVKRYVLLPRPSESSRLIV